MHPSVGSRVPELTAEAYVRGVRDPQTLGVPVHDGAWTALVFYPRDFTFVCPTELQGFARAAGCLRRRGRDLDGRQHRQLLQPQGVVREPFAARRRRYPVLADTSHELSRAFGVLGDDGSALRGTFLIDPDGVVRHASITDQNVGRSPAETLRVLQALRTGELCPVDWRPGVATLSVAA